MCFILLKFNRYFEGLRLGIYGRHLEIHSRHLRIHGRHLEKHGRHLELKGEIFVSCNLQRSLVAALCRDDGLF